MRVWQHVAKLRGEDADQIDLTFVLEEFLEAQLEVEWANFETTKRLGGPPKTDEQWKELLSEVTAKVKAEQQTK